MQYKDFLKDAHINEQLNVKGLNEYISLLKGEILDLKQRVIDIRFELNKVRDSHKESRK